jgi:hypothetical protein
VGLTDRPNPNLLVATPSWNAAATLSEPKSEVVVIGRGGGLA